MLNEQDTSAQVMSDTNPPNSDTTNNNPLDDLLVLSDTEEQPEENEEEEVKEFKFEPDPFMERVAETHYNRFEQVTDSYYELIDAIHHIGNKMSTIQKINFIAQLDDLNEQFESLEYTISQLLDVIDNQPDGLTDKSVERIRSRNKLRQMMETFMPMMIAWSALNTE